jgi:hypothetical protein
MKAELKAPSRPEAANQPRPGFPAESAVPEARQAQSEARQSDVKAQPAPSRPYGDLVPEYLGQIQDHYTREVENRTKAPQQAPSPGQRRFDSILKQHNIAGEFRDDEELVSRLAAGYRQEAFEKQQMLSHIQHLQSQMEELKTSHQSKPPQKEDLGELGWAAEYDQSWDHLLVEDPVTKEVLYREDSTPEQRRAHKEWESKREKTWKKWMSDPRSMAREISKFIDRDSIQAVAAETARQQFSHASQVQAQEGFLKDYLNRNKAVFFDQNQAGQQVPSAWANHMHSLFLPPQQGGRGMPLHEAVSQFERDYALAQFMSQRAQGSIPAPVQPAGPTTIATGIPNTTLEQAAATSNANRVTSPKEKSDGRASFGDMFKDQLRRSGVAV